MSARLAPFEPAHLEGLELDEINRGWLAGEWLKSAGTTFTLFDEGQVLGCGGLIAFDDETALGWTILFDAARRRPFSLHRTVRRALMALPAHWPVRIVAGCRKNHTAGRRWIERLGFRPVGEFEHMAEKFVRYERGRDFDPCSGGRTGRCWTERGGLAVGGQGG